MTVIENLKSISGVLVKNTQARLEHHGTSRAIALRRGKRRGCCDTARQSLQTLLAGMAAALTMPWGSDLSTPEQRKRLKRHFEESSRVHAEWGERCYQHPPPKTPAFPEDLRGLACETGSAAPATLAADSSNAI
jgi:hypothetical protein